MKVLLVEDSQVVRTYVEGIIRQAPDMEMLPSASDGAAGVRTAVAARPDVILMDLELPLLDGIAAIREIMAKAPCPIVVLSAYLESPERDRTFESFQAGAVEVLSKPGGLGDDAVTSFRDRLLRTIRLMAEARVIRRVAGRSAARTVEDRAIPRASWRDYDIVVIGASTGGPPILYDLLRELTPPFPLPIVVGQHIIPGFEQGLATWLGRTGHRTTIARAGERPEPGVVYVARADRHLAVHGAGFDLRAADGALAPSVNVLFESAADVFGERVVALLLSGMGSDGARGLAALRRRGALTIAQTGETCVVDGMPAAARALDSCCYAMSPAQMARFLAALAHPAPAAAGLGRRPDDIVHPARASSTHAPMRT